jgi:hypothetical protein
MRRDISIMDVVLVVFVCVCSFVLMNAIVDALCR